MSKANSRNPKSKDKVSKPAKPKDRSEKFRRADTGQYTTKEYASKHPDTTLKETDKRNQSKKK